MPRKQGKKGKAATPQKKKPVAVVNRIPALKKAPARQKVAPVQPAPPPAQPAPPPGQPAPPQPSPTFQQTIVCGPSDSALQCQDQPQFSDRFVYSKYYIPLLLTLQGKGIPKGTPAIPQYQLGSLYSALLAHPETVPIVEKSYSKLVETYFSANAARALAGALPIKQAKKAQPGNIAANIAQAAAVALGGPLPNEVDWTLGLIDSDIGYLFFDRTRIRPNGFAVGEHVYSLSLAPGEEVVLDQTAFSKIQTSYQEQTTLETQMNLELSSVLTTSVENGIQDQNNNSSTDGNKGVGLGVNVDGVDIHADLAGSSNLTQGDTTTASHSVKNSQTTSSKVASQYRSQHQITFSISREQTFQTTSKRVIKNPNQFTPIRLAFFKILNVLQMSQERYGVRLCWAPCIQDPAFGLIQRIQDGMNEIISNAMANVPPEPVKPSPPNAPPSQVNSVGPIPANKWGTLCDMRHDYDIAIPPPANSSNYVWDNDASFVIGSLMVSAPARCQDIFVVNNSVTWDGANVRFKVHIGCDYTNPIGGCGDCEITASANFVPPPNYQDPAYAAALLQWQQDDANWHQLHDQTLAKAQADANAWEQQALSSINPVAELMGRVIALFFPPTITRTCSEVEFWQDLFDWDDATYLLFPSWFSALPMRDPTKSPTDFVNASYAQLYLPIKPGKEFNALVWIYEYVHHQFVYSGAHIAGTVWTDTFNQVISDLNNYRTTNFGGVEEFTPIASVIVQENDGSSCPTYQSSYICLGKWTESLPTDGTHIEVIQSKTTAADSLTQTQALDNVNLKEALIANQTQNVELKKAAEQNMKSDTQSNVQVVVTDTPTKTDVTVG